MKLENGAFSTEIDDGMFLISISQESDCSLDGGYTFEDVTNVWELNEQTANDLMLELKEYIDRRKGS